MPFERLGLRDDATERDVRRAYAVLLKKTRPDDDPVAFQALHEAYQACLEELRDRREYAPELDQADENALDADDPGAAASPPGPRFAATVVPDASADSLQAASSDPDDDTVVDEAEGFNLTAFLDALYAQCETDTPSELEYWLNQQPELYSISLKSVLTVPVLRAVVQREPPLRPALLDVVATFFGASQLGRHHWWLVEQIDQTKARTLATDRFHTGRLPRANPQEAQREFDLVLDRHIALRKWRWTSLALMLMPGVPSRLDARITELDHLTEGASLELVNPRLRRVSATLADRSHVGRQRLALTWARALAVGLVLMVFFLVVMKAFRPDVLLGVAIAAAVFTGWQLLSAGFLALKRRVEQRGLGHRWREMSALALLLTAWVIALVPALSGRTAGIFVGIVGTLFAVTAARFAIGFALALFSGAAVYFAAAMDLVQWPVSPGLLAVTFPGFLALAVDRILASRTGAGVDELAAHPRALMFAAAKSAAVMVLLIALALAL